MAIRATRQIVAGHPAAALLLPHLMRPSGWA
jgi:hypothetical protein